MEIIKPKFLRIPLHKLNYAESFEEAIHFNPTFMEDYNSEYDEETRKSIYQEVEWAINHPEFNFARLAKVEGKFSNEQIILFLNKLFILLKVDNVG